LGKISGDTHFIGIVIMLVSFSEVSERYANIEYGKLFIQLNFSHS
jgi:hypothetical protein